MLYREAQKSFEEIYKALLESLGDRAKAFAAQNPYHAYYLGGQSTDPDVERLIEGNAYISAQIVQLLERQLPELTHTLAGIFFPQFLSPFPPCTMLEFKPSTLADVYEVPKGYQVRSIAVGESKTECEFRTTLGLDVLPIELKSVDLLVDRLELKFGLVYGAQLEDLQFTQLQLYMRQSALCYWLGRHVSEIAVTQVNHTSIEPEEQILLALSFAGFDQEETLLPFSDQFAATGYQILIEYFAFPEKFKFVNLKGVEEAPGLGALPKLAEQYPAEEDTPDAFVITFQFSEPPDLRNLRMGDIRLHCTPAVNLFDEVEIIEVDHHQSEYLVPKPRYNEIYAVDSVRPVFGQTPRYEPIYTLKTNPNRDDTIRYQIHLRSSIVDNRDAETYMSFVAPNELQPIPFSDRVAVHLTCTNWRLAEQLSAGHIKSKENEFRVFENIMRVTPSLRLPLDASLHWRLMAHLGQNRRSISTKESLKHVLSLCDFNRDSQEARANQRRLDGILSVSPPEKVTRLEEGLPIYGTEIEVEFDRAHFADMGDLFIFALVLDYFLQSYASVNSFIQLIAKDDRGIEILCPRQPQKSQKGQKYLL